jgi:class 3 adenylate cyclase/tetratricopeptide (TPR) repeat protein
MHCPQCQFANRDEASFCEECGAKLEQTCPACRSAVPLGRKFCGHCGQPLTAAPPAELKYASPQAYTPKHLAERILTSKSSMEGERKHVTVLFADVSGFTAMTEHLDPEDVHDIMDRAFEVILAAVHRFEGTINQFLGDGVMALFGAPIANEDHARRALSSALAIQEGLKPLREDVRRTHGVEFQVRIGINTGLVVVGAIGNDLRMDYTAVGDTTNLAARLMSLAQPGQVVLSRRTQHLREGFFVFEDLGEFQVKGKTELVRAYALVGEISGRTRLEVSKQRGLTPRFGRERELARLIDAYRRTAGGEAAVVMVAGEPGVGKSRLLYEFLQGLGGDGHLELETTCQSYARSIPYHPILDLVRRFLEISAGMNPEDIQARIADRLQALGIEGEEARILMAHFLGISASAEFLARLGPLLKKRTFELLREVFLRVSKSAPVVLIVENLHWIDVSSDEFLAHFAASLPGHGILLLLSARPGFSAPWLKPPLAETIQLEGLEAEHVQKMIRTLLGVERVSWALLKTLQAKGEGNPLYVEEILRQLQETHGIVLGEGEVRLSGEDVTVPATIHDIIAARIDRLTDPVKHSLQIAAVVGRRFALPLLSRVVESDGALLEHLGELQALDFVFLATQEPEVVYAFKHALTQDVAYTSLLERRRRLYHGAVGLGLEELYAERIGEMVELLAYHFGRSGETEKAVDYAILAGEKAQQRWANAEALMYFEDALKRLATMPDTKANRLRRIDAVIKQAEIKFALGRHAEHLKILEGIRDLVETSDDPRRRAAWYCWAGFLHSLTGSRPEIPIAYCQAASAIAQVGGFEEVHALAESTLAQVYTVAGNLRAALEAGEHALAFFEGHGNIWWASRTLWHLTVAANAVGEWERSLKYCQHALEHGQEVNDLRLKVVGLWRTGSLHIQRGDFQAGIQCCQEALSLVPIPFDAAMAKATHGYGLIKSGEVAAGTAELAEAVAWFDQLRLSFTHALFSLWLVDGYLRQGEPAKAHAILETALATIRGLGYRHLEGVGERLMGICLQSEDPPAAAGHLEAAARILEEVGARNEFAKALAAQAELRRAAGDGPGARQLLEQALTIFEGLGTLDEPPRVRAALAALPAKTPGGR